MWLFTKKKNIDIVPEEIPKGYRIRELDGKFYAQVHQPILGWQAIDENLDTWGATANMVRKAAHKSYTQAAKAIKGYSHLKSLSEN